MGFTDQKLKYVIDADASSATRALKSFYGDINKVGGGFTAVFGGMIPLAATAGAAIAGLGVTLFSLAKASSEYGSAIFDATEKTGLAAETISSMKVAADQSGTSLETVTSGLARFSKTIGAAGDGSAEAQGKLKKLGVTSNDLDTALAQALATISKYPPGVQQMTAAQAAFGKSGADLLPFIKSFDGNLPALIEKCKRLGLTLSNEDARAADEFGDTLDTLSAQAAATGRVFIGPLMKDITASMTNISGSLATNQTAVKQWGESLASTLRGLKNVSSEMYDFSQTRPGAFLSYLLFGSFIEINKALQRAGGPPAPQGSPLPHMIPQSERFGQKTTEPFYVDEEAKKAAEDRRKAREAEFQKENAARSRYNSLKLAAERSSFSSAQQEWENQFLSGEKDKEEYRKEALFNTLAYYNNVKKLLTESLQIQSVGKKGTELDAVKLENENALAALTREMVAEKADIDKTIAGEKKKADDESLKNAKQAAEDQIAIKRATAGTELAILETSLSLGIIKETEFAREHGRLQLEMLQQELALETVESRRQVLDEAIKTQVIRNANAIIAAIKLEGAAYIELQKSLQENPHLDQYGLPRPFIPPSPGLTRPDMNLDAKNRPILDAAGKTIEYSAAIDELSASFDRLKKAMESVVGMDNMLASMGHMAIDMFVNMTNAVGAAIAGWALYGDSIGVALKKALAAELAHISAIATVNAIYATALGFLRLAQYDFAGAAQAFTSAALWAALAGITALAAKALSPQQNGQGTAEGQTSGSSSGGGTGNRSGEEQPFSRASEGAFDSGNREMRRWVKMAENWGIQIPGRFGGSGQNRLAEAVEQLNSRLSSMRPGDVLVAGSRERRGFIGEQSVRDYRANAGTARQAASSMGIR